jgi:hypothetical protein
MAHAWELTLHNRLRGRIILSSNYLLTYSMEQSPSLEANRFSASQEIPSILWNPKVRYRIHRCSSPVSILSPQSSPVQSHFLNIIPPFTPVSPNWPLQIFSPKSFIRLSSPLYVLYAPLLISLELITRTILGKDYRSLSSSQCSFPHSSVISSL